MRHLAKWVVCLGVFGMACADAPTSGVTVEAGAESDVSLEDAGTLVDVDEETSEGGIVPVTKDVGTAIEPDAESEDTAESACEEGDLCDDQDPCTAEDMCVAGECVGTAYGCDDERTCTTDLCDGNGGCVHEPADGACLIGNVCYGDGDSAPQGLCGTCDAAVDPLSWTWEEGANCEDGDGCTADDVCAADGMCVGAPVVCDDDDACTQDSCGADGCIHVFSFGDCDDGDACTAEDLCIEGEGCQGGVEVVCTDDNPCTADTCDEGCVFTETTEPCEDGSLCTVGDACEGGECVSGQTLVCSDGSSCTDDVCDPALGCIYTLNENPCCTGVTNICSDGDDCTLDLCDPETGACVNEPFEGPCEDGDACTFEDTCFNGLCLGFPKLCEDDDPCTNDSCNSGVCLFEPGDGEPCDDGLACSTGDTCTAGVCVGDSSECVCEPEFSPVVNKIIEAALGETGMPGQGLDLDGDPSTCAPAGSCEGGIDNALGILSSFANESLAESLENGDLVLLLEHVGFTQNGGAFTSHFYLGTGASEGCNVQTEICEYLVAPESLDDSCNPVVVIGGVTVVDGVLNAGGPGTTLPFTIPLSDASLDITLYDVQIQGTVEVSDGKVTLLEGIIGGAVKQSELLEAINAVPEDSLPAGLSASFVAGLVQDLVAVDIDTNGDGVNEACSVGLPVKALAGKLVGLIP